MAQSINTPSEDIEDDFPDEDDELGEIIRKAMAETEDAGDDTVFSGPLDVPENTRVPIEKGLELVEEVTFKRGLDRRKDAATDMQSSKAQADGDDTAPAEGDEPVKAVEVTPASAADEIDTLLDGLEDDRRSAIKDRIAASDAMMSVFKGHEAALQAHGTTPDQVIRRLVSINEYANKKPDEYLAWAANQIDPENAEAILISAASKLGLKLVREDEDPFEDEETKAMRDENRRLKSRDRKLEFGPGDVTAPVGLTAEQSVEAITAFVNAKNADGTPAHPHWERLRGDVAERASAHKASTGKFITAQDLERFYREAESDARAAFGGQQTEPSAQPAQPAAAQARAPVASIVPTKAAASDSVNRAKAASKSIDGTGQGAGRRPALSADASLEDVIRHAAGYDD